MEIPPVTLRKGYKQLLAEANAVIETIAAEQAIELLDDQEVVVVDIRDVRELQREGRIPGSFHAPRGMIEFWIDPDSPYYKEIFGTGKRFVFHCASGWRSALVTQAVTQMGLTPVAHIGGGFKAWKEAGGPVTEYEKQATGRTPISASISS